MLLRPVGPPANHRLLFADFSTSPALAPFNALHQNGHMIRSTFVSYTCLDCYWEAQKRRLACSETNAATVWSIYKPNFAAQNRTSKSLLGSSTAPRQSGAALLSNGTKADFQRAIYEYKNMHITCSLCNRNCYIPGFSDLLIDSNARIRNII